MAITKIDGNAALTTNLELNLKTLFSRGEKNVFSMLNMFISATLDRSLFKRIIFFP